MKTVSSRRWVAAIIALSVLTPVAGYFFFRTQIFICGLIPPLNVGMPWPDPWPTVVQVICAAFVLAYLVVAIAGIRNGRGPRVAGITTLSIVILAGPAVVFLALFLSVYGDPGPGHHC
jgi:hypothetical protein